MIPDGIQARLDELQKELIRKLIQQITVYGDHFTVRFKSGLEIDINRYDSRFTPAVFWLFSAITIICRI